MQRIISIVFLCCLGALTSLAQVHIKVAGGWAFAPKQAVVQGRVGYLVASQADVSASVSRYFGDNVEEEVYASALHGNYLMQLGKLGLYPTLAVNYAWSNADVQAWGGAAGVGAQIKLYRQWVWWSEGVYGWNTLVGNGVMLHTGIAYYFKEYEEY
jgi:hypothetical protein